MVKSVPKKAVVPEVEPQTLPNLWSTLCGVFEDDHFMYTTLCVVTSVITILVTVVFLVNLFKRQRNADEPAAGDGDKKENDEVQGEKQVTDKDGVDGENPDTSEGQDGSEEDLPWILQKAPSQTTLSADEKENWNDEKQSDGTESEKSQDFAKLRKSAAGDLDGAANGVKVITAEGEFVEE